MRVNAPSSSNRRATPGSRGVAAFLRRLVVLLVAMSALSHAFVSGAAATAPEPPERWQPEVGASWQWQLTGEPDLSFDVDVYDLDLFDTPEDVVDALHAEGRAAICYVSVGTVEDWRPDVDRFPAAVVGDEYDEWPGERWLDVRRFSLLAPVLRDRLDLCREKGFDGVEPDNVDGFTNETGFDLSVEDELRFIRWLADEAHARGLSIGLKNADELVDDLVDDLDWALTEDCYADDWCEALEFFVRADKPVFMAEYTDRLSTKEFRDEACSLSADLGFSAILKDRDLDAERVACP
jgi:hypothetical protein